MYLTNEKAHLCPSFNQPSALHSSGSYQPQELITLANQDRAASHIAPFKENPNLTKAA